MAATAAERPLRVAYVWNQTIQYEELLQQPQLVGLGAGELFPLPDDVSGHDRMTLLTPRGNGYTLEANPALGGDVWIGGQRKRVSTLGGPVELGPGDYGVVTLGPVAIFFQHVLGAKPPPRQPFEISVALVAALMLALLLASVILIIAYADWQRRGAGQRDPFELDSDLITRFMVTPPPEDLFEQEFAPESGTETEDPGLHDREEAGGEAHEGDEGRVGNENADQENTEIEGEVADEVVASVQNLGLLGALDGGEGNAIAAALDVPDIGDILAGTGAATTMVGRGSGGAGLRGLGMGGGGTGPGSLLGTGGGVGTGVGMGRGRGRGMGGIGAPGRMNAEVMVSVMRGTARVNGYLSAEQINRVVRANQAAIRYCYEVQVQRQPNLRGRVEINWRIDLSGRVTTARVARSSLGSGAVEGCIVRQVRRWRFPRPDGGEVNVTYPFIFGLQGG